MRPRPLLRFLFIALLPAVATLRGQVTEWPATVAPGRFRLEMDVLSFALDRSGGDKYTAVGAGTAFISTGLTDNLDVQLGAELFLSQSYESGGVTERNSGIGDLYVRTKWRFYEDTALGTAMAIIPYVKIPTNSGGVGNDAMEGGVVLPFSKEIAGGATLYTMAELDFLRNDANDGYDTYWYASAAFYRPLTARFSFYAEATLGKSSGGTAVESEMGGGVILSLSDETWWDFAAYKGISDEAADWNYVVRFNFGF